MPYGFAFFDVDSTLVTIEGIDVLANGDPEIANLTEAAMNGEIPLDQVYGKRLEAIRPARDRVAELAAMYLRSMVEGASDTISALQTSGVIVHLVTAAIEQAVLPLADALNIPHRNVHAV